MGRPLKKSNFGANSNDNIKVQFHNGTASVKGYIVKQYGSRKFKCKDVNGVVAVCKLVDKASASLAAGEMTITLKGDDSQINQAVRIHKNLATVAYSGTNYVTGGTHNSTVSYGQVKWSYGDATDDTYWQIEEAGNNAAMANATDLEGDDINGDYPVPGSSSYHTGTVALSGVVYANNGTPYAVGGSTGTVTSSASGLYRTKYDGNFTAASSSAPGTWNYSFFSTATVIKSIPDTYVSWGQQTDGSGLGEHNFSMEWKGYIKVPTTQNYNLFAESDDHIAVWIGTDATAAASSSTYTVASNNKAMPGNAAVSGVYSPNSLTLDSTKWYPIRVWFSEHLGGCKAQIYLQGADGTKYSGSEILTAYNTVTSGF